MLNMKHASVREIQHNLRKVLEYLDHGNEIIVLNRNKPIAKIVPYTRQETSIAFPDFKKRRERFLSGTGNSFLSGIILEDRGEKV